MERRHFLRLATAGLLAGPALTRPRAQNAPATSGAVASRPNILLITVDDMNCDSIGVFGCRLKDTSPNIDRFAGEGIRFEHAHLQVANCMPSRNVMQTGRYSHTSGVEGFYQVKVDFPILPELLRDAGYFVGIIGKVPHSSPSQPFPGDLIETKGTGGLLKSAQHHYDFTKKVIEQSRAAGKPFYALINITDPHLPHYGSPQAERAGHNQFPPSKTFTLEEVPIPGYLPNISESRLEMKRYYDSVRRADDLTAATLKALDDAGLRDNTVVIFLSDNGMPFPFAKTCEYYHSTHTPWIVRWPGKVKPGTVDREHMISTIDFAPTVLEIAGLPVPPAMQGRSYLPLLLGQQQDGRDHTIKEYNENSGGSRNPMRGVQTRKYLYLFNPWANGERRFRTATQGTDTYRAMVRLAPESKAIADRVHLLDYRVLEELYDCEKDPDNLVNLIDEPALQPEVERLRKLLEDWMIRTNDRWLEALRNRGDAELRERLMKEEETASAERRKGKGKRASVAGEDDDEAALEGETGAPAKGAAKKAGAKKGAAAKNAGANLIAIEPPAPNLARGQKLVVRVRHELPADLGEQLLTVTAKGGAEQKFDRQTATIRGAGVAEVALMLPADPNVTHVVIAAFVGPDFQASLQHVVTAPIPMR